MEWRRKRLSCREILRERVGTDEPDGGNAESRVRKNERRREVEGRVGTRIIEDEFPSLRG